MKTFIDYQYQPKDAPRPIDNGDVVTTEAHSEDGTVFVPAVGDYVHIDNSMRGQDRASFSGTVKSKLFRYIRTPEGIVCQINIVVEETDDDWGQLIKE